MDRKKKKVLEIAFVIVFLPVMLAVAIGGAKYLAYRDNRMRCDDPLPANKVRDIGVAMPEGVVVCSRSGRDESASYRLLVEAPAPLCLATADQLGCASLTKVALKFVGANDEWGTGKIESSADSATVELLRKRESAHIRLSRSHFGEITADLDVRLAPSRVTHASDD